MCTYCHIFQVTLLELGFARIHTQRLAKGTCREGYNQDRYLWKSYSNKNLFVGKVASEVVLSMQGAVETETNQELP